jgi:hypothetical protein
MENLESKNEIIDKSVKAWNESNVDTNANQVVYMSIYSMATQIDYQQLSVMLLETAKQLTQ